MKPGIGEHHTIPWENLPAPDLFIAKALAMTKNIKLGTGVVLLQLHDPKMLADRIATLDYLAEGRFYFGIGTGGVPTEFEYFGIEEGNRHARAAETIEAVLKIWESKGQLDYQGEFHQVTAPAPRLDGTLKLWLEPYTKPHPPIAVAAVSPNSSTVRVGRRERLDTHDHRASRPGQNPDPLGGIQPGSSQDGKDTRPARVAHLC